MEEQPELKQKEAPQANIAWVEKYRPGALQDLISHEGMQFLFQCLSGIKIFENVKVSEVS